MINPSSTKLVINFILIGKLINGLIVAALVVLLEGREYLNM